MNKKDILECKTIVEKKEKIKAEEQKELNEIYTKYQNRFKQACQKFNLAERELKELVYNYTKKSLSKSEDCEECSKREYSEWLNNYDLSMKTEGICCYYDADHPNDSRLYTITWDELISYCN